MGAACPAATLVMKHADQAAQDLGLSPEVTAMSWEGRTLVPACSPYCLPGI